MRLPPQPLQRSTRWLLRHPTGRWVVLAGVVGGLCGVIGAVFTVSADLLTRVLAEGLAGLPWVATAAHPPASALGHAVGPAWSPWWMLAALAAGGWTAGWVIARLSSAAKGSGTGQAVDAFHRGDGIIPWRVPLAKLIASVLTLGSGGSGGREGPISLMGAGLGSWFAQQLVLSVRDRRILLVAGMAGGIAAVFRAPLASAVFAAEILYRGPDAETEAIVPSFIAAVVGYLVGGFGIDLLSAMLGMPGMVSSTLFAPPPLSFLRADWPQLAGYTLVALASVLVARWMVFIQRVTARGFDILPLPWWSKPGIGAVLAGAIATIGYLLTATLIPACPDPGISLATMGSGYGIIQWLFTGGSAGIGPLALAGLLAGIAWVKAVTTACTIASGGSAGWFGPSLVIGGCLGGSVGLLLHGTVIAPPPSACVLMGMAAVLAATHRTPVAAVLMVSEIAGTWLLLLPTMWVSGLAFLLMGSRSLVGGQVDGFADSPAHGHHQQPS